MMLPKLSEIDPSYTTSLPTGSGIFNHPVIILSQQVYKGKVAVFILTSFDSTPIQNRYRDPIRRRSYLPILPASHPDTSSVLIVAHGKVMKKQSYINFKELYEIPFTVLRPCWRDSDLHLEKASYQILTAELWKRNVGELGVTLSGHGILEQTSQPVYGQVPVPTSSYPLPNYYQHPVYGTTSTGMYDPPISESYETFAQTPPDAYRPHTSTPYWTDPATSVAKNAAWIQNYSVRAHQVRQARLARSTHLMTERTRFPVDQCAHDEGNNDGSCLRIFVILCVFVGWLVLLG
jgi:hypothetical protein